MRRPCNSSNKMAKKAAKKAAAPVKKETVKKVKVVAIRPLVEGGEKFAPGDEFETSAKRAKALGPVVKPASDE